MQAIGIRKDHFKIFFYKAGLLKMHILLIIKTRIMLFKNLWVVKSLINGNIGIIDNIIWEKGAD